MKYQQRGSATVWIVIVVSLVVVVGGLILLSTAGSKPTGTSSLPIDKAAANDWMNGNAKSTVTLIEYSDLQCPACGAYHPIVKQLEQDYQDKVNFVFRHFPLPQHTNAMPAARSAEAAGLQGKFFEMRDRMYETQDAWSNLADPSKTFEGYAKDLNLDVEKYKTVVNGQLVRDHVNEHITSGKAVGVDGTPTFFLNGTKLKNPATIENFKKLIDDAIIKSLSVQ